MLDNKIQTDIEYAKQLLEIEKLQKHIEYLAKELNLYKSVYPRPKILKEVIHHPAHSRDSQCLYGKSAWDEYIYE